MNEQPFASLEACFGDMPDPRVQGRCDHALIDIILIAVCAGDIKKVSPVMWVVGLLSAINLFVSMPH